VLALHFGLEDQTGVAAPVQKTEQTEHFFRFQHGKRFVEAVEWRETQQFQIARPVCFGAEKVRSKRLTSLRRCPAELFSCSSVRVASTGIAEWHRVIVWDELAEGVRSLAKGDHVLVDGELRSSSYLKHVNIGVDTITVPTTSWEIRAKAVRKLVRKQKPARKPAKALKAAA